MALPAVTMPSSILQPCSCELDGSRIPDPSADSRSSIPVIAKHSWELLVSFPVSQH